MEDEDYDIDDTTCRQRVRASAHRARGCDGTGARIGKSENLFHIQSRRAPRGLTLPLELPFKLRHNRVQDVVQVSMRRIKTGDVLTSRRTVEADEDYVITFAELRRQRPAVRFWITGSRVRKVYPWIRRAACQLTRSARARHDANISDQASADQAKVQVVEPSGATAEFDPSAPEAARADSAPAQAPSPRAEPRAATPDASGAAQTRVESQPSAQESAPAPRGTSGRVPAESQSARNELPATAGIDPLIGLIGLISLCGFVAARFACSIDSRTWSA